MLALVALSVILVGAGALQWSARMAIPLGIGAVSGSLALLTAWSLRRDRDDPAGIERRERRLEAATIVWAAALLLVGLLAVAGIILWGLVSRG
jgi:hypothetical protein